MSRESNGISAGRKNLAQVLLAKRYWWIHFLIVAAISTVGLLYIGIATYSAAPPLVDYVSTSTGETVIPVQLINRGKEVFHLRGLMNYGSFLGDGAERGPDFTADALHLTLVGMSEYYAKPEVNGRVATDYYLDAIAARVQRELHENLWDESAGVIGMNDAQIYAYGELNKHYVQMFTDADYSEAMEPIGYISNPADLQALTAFFYWGGWQTAANRPGEVYSYTHNWPPDVAAGNTPTMAVYLWSFLSIFALFIGVGVILYVYGEIKAMPGEPGDVDDRAERSVFDGHNSALGTLTTEDLEKQYVRPTQRATYKFFVFAILCFVIQVFVGIISTNDFIRVDTLFGLDIASIIPFTVARSLHLTLQIYWFFLCWIGYTLFLLPRLSRVPPGQLGLTNLLFGLCVLVGGGAIVGIFLGPMGYLSDNMAYWFGSQGWEFMELGRFWQFLLLGSFCLWILIIYRGVKPWLTKENVWSVPSWLLYGSGVMVLFLFFGLFVTPTANFAISDYWRWMVVHMWVEATFEVFTTVVVGYLLVQMGLITRPMAERVIFLAVMLFLVTALIGISHNFYWIAKPTGVIALGSVFSTLQVLPLLLLTLDAWKMRQEGKRGHAGLAAGRQSTVMEAVWLFVLGVNFWNIFGAGVFGSLLNLPIINYFEHATYITGNHAHAAMFGVKGNVALAGVLFCCQHLFKRDAWNEGLVRRIFWSLNGGLVLMMFLDLFPAGLYQMMMVITNGLWYARSSAVTEGAVFTFLTYMRIIGGLVFVCGGVLPLAWFIISRGTKLQREVEVAEGEWSVYDKDWAAQEESRAIGDD